MTVNKVAGVKLIWKCGMIARSLFGQVAASLKTKLKASYGRYLSD